MTSFEIDQKTSFVGLFLPHPDNIQRHDILRISNSFLLVDSAFKGQDGRLKHLEEEAKKIRYDFKKYKTRKRLEDLMGEKLW